MVAWLLEQAGNFGDLIALITVIATGGLWVVRMLMAGKKQVESLFTQQKNMQAEQEQIKTVLSDIASQFKPNGGTSLFDMIQSIRDYQWNLAEIVTDKPIWECDEKGQCVRVNLAYTRLAERNSSEMLGAGWENFVHQSDRSRVFDEWTDAVARKRTFETTFRVVSRSGKTFQVKATAKPVETTSGRIVAFVGRYDDVMQVT